MYSVNRLKAVISTKWVLRLAPLLFLLVNENRAWLFLNVVIWLALIWLGNGMKRTAFYMLLLNLPFETGLRGWQVWVVNPQVAANTQGYSFYFGLTIKYFWWAVLMVSYFEEILLYIRPKLVDYLMEWLLIWVAINTLIRGELMGVEMLGLVKVVYLVGVYFIGRLFWQEREVRRNFDYILEGWLWFFGLVGIGQWLRGGTLGLYLEETNYAAPFGFWTNESKFLVRAAGTMGHPTFFSSWLSMILILAMARFWTLKGKRVWVGGGALVSLMALVATYGRSAWVALLIGVGWLYLKWGRKEKVSLKYLWVTLILVAIGGGAWLVTRLSSFGEFLSLGGSGVGRVELLVDWFYVMKNNWFWGVGLNRFTEAMYQVKATEAYRYFLFPVHNTWMMLTAELGVMAGLILIWLVIVILKTRPKRLVMGAWWVMVVVFLINSQIHALFYQDPTIDLFILAVGYLGWRNK